MSVSEREREFMQRLGAYKAASHAEARAHHSALPLGERLRRSWSLYLAGRESAQLGQREDDPSPFYARARARGMCSD